MKTNQAKYQNIGPVLPDNPIQRHSRMSLSGIPTAFNNTQGGYPRTLRAAASGMTAPFKEEALNKNTFRAPLRSGFTLIELLVVILIIGILTTIALPQYQLAVDKARLSKLITLASTVEKAEEIYFLANGTYTTDWNKLDLTFTGEITENKLSSPEGWELKLSNGITSGVIAYHEELPNINLIFFFLQSKEKSWHGHWCYAVRTNKRANTLCQQTTKATTKEAVNNYKGEPSYTYPFPNSHYVGS